MDFLRLPCWRKVMGFSKNLSSIEYSLSKGGMESHHPKRMEKEWLVGKAERLGAIQEEE
jgi:hypothetical protein